MAQCDCVKRVEDLVKWKGKNIPRVHTLCYCIAHPAAERCDCAFCILADQVATPKDRNLLPAIR